MGGRAAEELYMGIDEISSGCSSDLAKATELAYLYVKQLGMQNSLIAGNTVRTSDRYDYEVDLEVKKLLSVPPLDS